MVGPSKITRPKARSTKRKSGAQKGKLNAVRSGTSIMRTRLVVGELPKQLISVRKEGRAYRVKLEAAVLEKKGDISVCDAHLIDTASAATMAAAIGRWVLRHKLTGMKGTEILACSREIVKAKQARDAAVRALGLDAKPAAPWIDAGSEPA